MSRLKVYDSGTTQWVYVNSGGGSVTGPVSSTDNAVARYDSTTGKLIQNSVVTIADTTGLIEGSQGIALTGIASPTYAQGKLVYDTDNQSLTFYNNDSNIALQLGQEEWLRVTNNTGSTIANGAVVYLSGASAGLPTIALAKADAAATTIGAGLTTESIANGSTGWVTTMGAIHGLDTSAFTAGATLFISAATAGALTATAPSAPNYRYRIGIVGVSSATVGTIHVTPSTAALGNGTANQVFGINNAGTAQEVKSILGTTNVISVTHAANSITLNVGSNVPTTTSTTTLTNKRITKRVVTVNAPGATPASDIDNSDILEFTGLATAITSMTTNIAGTPTNGQMVEFIFVDNGTARAITWGASFANGGLVNLPTTTVINTALRVLVQYQTIASLNKWVCIGVA